MDAGYFPTTYNPHEYFPVGPQYFPEYGAPAAPAPTVASDMYPHGHRRRRKKRSLFDDTEFVEALIKFVEIL